MIPLKIMLENFGAIPEADIDLTAVDLAAIVGPNGAGKSTAFTAAPMWALFGETKNGVGPDAMVRTGETEASVTFVFEHDGDRWAVVRTRSTGGRGKSGLELAKWSSEIDNWESRSGATIRETEERIRQLLNLDAETFCASSMILQGRADEFTGKPAGQRKAILSQILGLEIYDRLQTAAKRKANEKAIEIETAKATLERLEFEASARADLVHEQAVLETAIGEMKQTLTDARQRAQDAQERLDAAKRANDTRVANQARLDALSAEIEGFRNDVADINKRSEQAEKLLEMKDHLLKMDAEYKELQKQAESMNEDEARLSKIRNEISELQREYDERSSRFAELGRRMAESKALLDQKDQALLARSEQLTLTEELQGLYEKQDKVAVLERNAERLDDHIRDARSRASMLDNSNCVAPDKAAETPCRFLQEAVAARDSLADMERARGETEKRIQETGYDSERCAQVENRIEELRPLAERVAEIEAQEKVNGALFEQMKDISDRQKELLSRTADLKKESGALETAVADSADIKQRLEELAKWQNGVAMLPKAEAELASRDERLGFIEKTMEDKRLEAKRLMAENNDLADMASSLADLMQAHAEHRGAAAALENDYADLHAKLGAMNARLEAVTKADQEATALRAELKPKDEALTRWSTLVKAFGRDGIPALIIENAVPELERISNEILARMTNGRNSVRFDTQRNLKSKAGVAETLDILVSDWQGERPYETFSGGEQLRINFAIRFALAELLASRAGSRVEWLTIDEGLGSQDKEHRDLVLEAIRAVADRFKKVLVITHIEEAQGVFPQQITFKRNTDGVEVNVT